MTPLRTIFLALLAGSCVASAASANPRAETVDTLGSIRPTWKAAGLEAWLDSTRRGGEIQLALGQPIEFGIRSRSDSYVTAILVDGHGVCSVLLPSPSSRTGFLPSYSEMRLPSGGSSRVAVPPLGRRTLYAFATPRPLSPRELGRAGAATIDEDDCPAFARELREILARRPRVATARVDLRVVGRFKTRGPAGAGRGSRTEYDVDDVVGYFSGLRTRSISRRRLDVRVQFAFDSAELTREAREQIDVFGDALGRSALRDKGFVVAGHTDDVGSARYNVGLSRRRAASVRRYLVERHGIEPDRLVVRGFGEHRPLESGASPEARAINRRVEFELTATPMAAN